MVLMYPLIVTHKVGSGSMVDSAPVVPTQVGYKVRVRVSYV